MAFCLTGTFSMKMRLEIEARRLSPASREIENV
jgi:hypothetical protein